MSYNLNFAFLAEGLTPGGEAPRIIHFADRKPFQAYLPNPSFRKFCIDRWMLVDAHGLQGMWVMMPLTVITFKACMHSGSGCSKTCVQLVAGCNSLLYSTCDSL